MSLQIMGIWRMSIFVTMEIIENLVLVKKQLDLALDVCF